MFSDTSEHTRADLFFVVKSPDIVRVFRIAVAKFDVGTTLGTTSQPIFNNALRTMRARELGHALMPICSQC
jgi:hypothetical protein